MGSRVCTELSAKSPWSDERRNVSNRDTTPAKTLAERLPYSDIFDSPQDYFEQVYPTQLDSLRTEYAEADPKQQFVFCYGKKYWQYHREIFNFAAFQPALDGKVQWGRNESTVFVLTNFFGYGWTGFGENFIDSLCELAISKSSHDFNART